jgi:3-phenylpropionate/trans-cinnamate dioxygenase ferredoxin reductase component
MADTRIDYLLIGGGRTSANAAQAIRENDPNGSIMIVTSEDRKPYDRPPLSKNFLEGRPPNPDDVESKPDDFFDKHNVQLIRGVAADSVDRELKLVTLSDGRRFEYGKLLIATGASPIKLDIPGADGDNVYYLRSVDDAMKIRDAAKGRKTAAFIGAGFIGIEGSASLTNVGVKCTVIGREGALWDRFLSDATSKWLQGYFEGKGVQFRLNANTSEIFDGGVKLSSGESVEGDMVVIGIGVRLNLGLAKDSGLELDGNNGILTDANLQTNDPNIWAAGDVAAYQDPNFGRRWHLEHYMNADWQGTQVGKNMSGPPEAFNKVPYFYSDMFDLSFLLRGDPNGGQSVKVIGDRDSAEFIELYAYEDGRLAMGILFTRDYKTQDEKGDKIAQYVLDKRQAADLEAGDFF